MICVFTFKGDEEKTDGSFYDCPMSKLFYKKEVIETSFENYLKLKFPFLLQNEITTE